MRDPLTFETRLADAFDRYTGAAPAELTSRDLVHLVTTASTAGHTGIGIRLGLGSRPRTASLALAVLLLALAAMAMALVAGAIPKRAVEPRTGPSFIARDDGMYKAAGLGQAERLLIGGRRVLNVEVSPSGRFVAMRYVPAADASEMPLAGLVDADGQPVGPNGPSGSIASIPRDDAGVPVWISDIAWAPVPVDGHELLALATSSGPLVVDETGSLVLDPRGIADTRALINPSQGSEGLAWSSPGAGGDLQLAWGAGSAVWLTSFAPGSPATTRLLADLGPLDFATRGSGAPSPRGSVRDVAIAPDGSWVAAIVSDCGFACAAGLWAVSADGSATLLDGHAQTDGWLSGSPDGRSVLAGLWGDATRTDSTKSNWFVPVERAGETAVADRSAEFRPVLPEAPTGDYPAHVRWMAGGERVLVGTPSGDDGSWSFADPPPLDLWSVLPDGSGAQLLARNALDIDVAPIP